MRQLLYLSLLLFISSNAISQPQPAVIDSFKTELKKATTNEQKVSLLGNLSRLMMNINPVEADKYGKEMMEVAEVSRDRKLMIKALLINGERYSFLAGRKDNLNKAINYYNQALELAKVNKLDEQMVGVYLSLSEVHRFIPDAEKALNYCNQAFSYMGLLKNDSLAARVHLEYGLVYTTKNEKKLALRNLFSALRISEESKNDFLLRAAYSRLSVFYAGIEENDKAIDYQVKALQVLDRIKNGQTPYNRVQDLNRLGDLYATKRNSDMAMFYYEKSLKLADSLKYDPIKVMTYRSIVNNYLNNDQPKKALDYFNEHPQLKDFLQRVNFGYFIDQSYGYIYARLGNYDSAKYFYTKVAPFFEKDVNVSNQYSYYYQLGLLHKETKEYDKSIEYFTKAKDVADKIASLELMNIAATNLDSLYQQKNDYKQAFYFSSLSKQYKDSLDKLGKEQDLLQLEAADEQQRLERDLATAAEIKRRRNNIQYMAITLGIVALFIALVILGMFKVSATTIKMLGFFAFLMFFEFIFLIFKKNIYSITKGEPWKDLLFMIGLAAILLPLHHWMEHKVIKYLTSHNRLTKAGYHIKTKFLGRKKVS